MAVIVVGGLKGGGGKSTIATNLVIMRAKDHNRDVLL
jgi:cellulose biosynthesis protein BcsQ